ncbi:unnamed protein product [Cyclocybe aegerita]|uniref:Uncharacterized protein n=1 Tax=Cyclocybe aegerita TaxID=1973307 RepID=A0A8S0VV03_CYCAE|nr:unnamed protein product [Cyclocybe aegerita]
MSGPLVLDRSNLSNEEPVLSYDSNLSSAQTARDQRTPTQIFLNCLFTLLICIWFCCRPNIPVTPPPHTKWRESWIPIIRARVTLAIWLLLSPHFVLVWAFRQWRGATALKEKYANSGPGWTRAHGFMMNMGGFMLYKEGLATQVLSPKSFETLWRFGAIDFPWTMEEEIVDRGNSGVALALCFGLQTVWFVGQCIERMARYGRDALTLLELETACIVVVSWVTAAVFWEKPLDSRVPIRVDLKIEIEIPDEREPGFFFPMFENTNAEQWREESIQRKLLAILAAEYGHDPPRIERRCSPFTSVLQKLCLPFRWIITSLYGPYNLIVYSPRSFPRGILTVPTFYHIDDKALDKVMWLQSLGNIIWLLNGAAHLILWTSPQFQNSESPMWMCLWRICVGMTIATPALFYALQLLNKASRHLPRNGVGLLLLIVFVGFAGLVGLLGVLVCAVARVILLIQALLSLTSMPPQGLQSVEWTGYIPHFG